MPVSKSEAWKKQAVEKWLQKTQREENVLFSSKSLMDHGGDDDND